MRLAARTDSNHAAIVAAYRKRGYSVLDVSKLKNCCDLMVSKNYQTWAVEIKDGKKPPSARKLTAGEQTFRDGWKGMYIIITCEEDI